VLAAAAGVAATGATQAGDTSSQRQKAPVNCRAPDAPYREYDCLEAYLGEGFLERLINYYWLEWGHEKPPTDPKAPSARRAEWPDAPTTTPPYPFTEWPYGGTTAIGVTRPASVDSPLMVALANTAFGQVLKAGNMQIYGWINGGGNVSSNTVKPGGNWPAAYDFTPNRDQLDQAVVYFERLPDTVQTDHVDWGLQGQKTGTKTRYVTMGLGWQHWFSPQVELRPEVTYYRALDAPAFNGNFNANPAIPPSKKDALIVAADLIWHF